MSALDELVELRTLLQRAIDHRNDTVGTLREIIDLLRREGNRLGDSEIKTVMKTSPLSKGMKNSQEIIETYRELLKTVNAEIARRSGGLRLVNEEDEKTLDAIRGLEQTPREAIPAHPSVEQIDALIEKAEKVAATIRELHASFLHHYTWRLPGQWYYDGNQRRVYPRDDQKRISKSRYDRIVRAIKALSQKVNRRVELLRTLRERASM